MFKVGQKVRQKGNHNAIGVVVKPAGNDYPGDLNIVDFSQSGGLRHCCSNEFIEPVGLRAEQLIGKWAYRINPVIRMDGRKIDGWRRDPVLILRIDEKGIAIWDKKDEAGRTSYTKDHPFYAGTHFLDDNWAEWVVEPTEPVKIEPVAPKKSHPAVGDKVKIVDSDGGHLLGAIGEIVEEDHAGELFRIRFADGKSSWAQERRFELVTGWVAPIKIEEKPAQLNPGDRVHIVASKLISGCQGAGSGNGVVTADNSNSGLLSCTPGINVKFDDGCIWRVNPDAVVAYDPTKGETKYKVGDTVRAAKTIKHWGMTEGDIGVVAWVGDGTYTVKFPYDGKYLQDEHIEPFTFRVGDHVRVKSANHNFLSEKQIGLTGTITEKRGDHAFSIDGEWSVHPDDMEIFEASKTYKVGDRVVTVKQIHNISLKQVPVGTIGTTKEIDDDGAIRVNFDNGETWFAYDDEIRLYDAGDKAREDADKEERAKENAITNAIKDNKAKDRELWQQAKARYEKILDTITEINDNGLSSCGSKKLGILECGFCVQNRESQQSDCTKCGWRKALGSCTRYEWSDIRGGLRDAKRATEAILTKINAQLKG